MTEKPKVCKLKLDKKFSEKLEMLIGCKAGFNQNTHKHLPSTSISINNKYKKPKNVIGSNNIISDNINSPSQQIGSNIIGSNNISSDNINSPSQQIGSNIIGSNNISSDNINSPSQQIVQPNVVQTNQDSTNIIINLDSSYKMTFIFGTLFGIGLSLGLKIGYLVFFLKVG